MTTSLRTVARPFTRLGRAIWSVRSVLFWVGYLLWIGVSLLVLTWAAASRGATFRGADVYSPGDVFLTIDIFGIQREILSASLSVQWALMGAWLLLILTYPFVFRLESSLQAVGRLIGVVGRLLFELVMALPLFVLFVLWVFGLGEFSINPVFEGTDRLYEFTWHSFVEILYSWSADGFGGRLPAVSGFGWALWVVATLAVFLVTLRLVLRYGRLDRWLRGLIVMMEHYDMASRFRRWLTGRLDRSRLIPVLDNNPLFIVTWMVLLVGWQAASFAVPMGTLEHPLVPGFDYILFNQDGGIYRLGGNWDLQGGRTFGPISLVDFDNLAAFSFREGAEARSWTAVILAIIYQSTETFTRLIVGLGSGLFIGLLTGLGLSYFQPLRQISWVPFNFLRMIPLLAAIPWMQFALGADLRALGIFIAFGVWVTLVVATMNSVSNVADRYIESARTLGASRLRTYFSVIIPGAMPELRTALLLSGGLGWSLAIAGEFLGFPTGLGYMAASAVQETNTARLVVIAIIVAFYSLLSFYFLNQMFSRLVSWMPQRASASDVSKVAALAGTSSRAQP